MKLCNNAYASCTCIILSITHKLNLAQLHHITCLKIINLHNSRNNLIEFRQHNSYIESFPIYSSSLLKKFPLHKYRSPQNWIYWSLFYLSKIFLSLQVWETKSWRERKRKRECLFFPLQTRNSPKIVHQSPLYESHTKQGKIIWKPFGSFWSSKHDRRQTLKLFSPSSLKEQNYNCLYHKGITNINFWSLLKKHASGQVFLTKL